MMKSIKSIYLSSICILFLCCQTDPQIIVSNSSYEFPQSESLWIHEHEQIVSVGPNNDLFRWIFRDSFYLGKDTIMEVFSVKLTSKINRDTADGPRHLAFREMRGTIVHIARAVIFPFDLQIRKFEGRAGWFRFDKKTGVVSIPYYDIVNDKIFELAVADYGATIGEKVILHKINANNTVSVLESTLFEVSQDRIADLNLIRQKFDGFNFARISVLHTPTYNLTNYGTFTESSGSGVMLDNFELQHLNADHTIKLYYGGDMVSSP